MNKINIKYCFPIPHLDNILNELHRTTIFSNIDLFTVNQQIQMRWGDEWKSTFKTRDNLYVWMVMEIDLSNVLNTFMWIMIYIFYWKFWCCILRWYFGVQQAKGATFRASSASIQNIKEQKFFANLKKCHFFTNSLMFFGSVVSGKGIQMDPSKIEEFKSWPMPKPLHDIQNFHSLASFYRQLIKEFITIIEPIIECLKRGTFKWTNEAKIVLNSSRKRKQKLLLSHYQLLTRYSGLIVILLMWALVPFSAKKEILSLSFMKH